MNYSLAISVRPLPMLLGSLLQGAVFHATGVLRLGVGSGVAVLLALGCVSAHWMLELIHHAGHFIASVRVGRPMRGVVLGEGLFFGRSLYAENEPPLHARVHIPRALGGPTLSTLIGIVLAGLVPLGFTDGGTLLKRWPLRDAAA